MTAGIKQYGATGDAIVDPTITAGAYSAGDAVGGKLIFTELLKTNRAGGAQIAMTVADKAKQNATLYLVLFDRDFTPTTDNAEFDPSNDDLLNVIAIIKLYSTDYTLFKNNSIGEAVSNKPIKSYSDDGTIYGQLFTPDTPTYGSTSDLRIRLICLTDVR